jgi:hypothetical protein
MEGAAMINPEREKRTRLYTIITTIVLLAAVFLILTDNNRKYSTNFESTVQSIMSTNRALVAPGFTASAQAIATGLPLTQTRAAIPQTSTPPYEPTLYAQRRLLYGHLMSTSDPTALTIFILTDQALIATYQATKTAGS